jgi:hypothetical protein
MKSAEIAFAEPLFWFGTTLAVVAALLWPEGARAARICPP